MLQNNEDFLSPVVHHYLVQCLDSIAIERLRSTFAIADTKLNQARTPDNMNKIMICLKELQEEKSLDLIGLVRIFCAQKKMGKLIEIPEYRILLDANKSVLNIQEDLESRRRKRRIKYAKIFARRNKDEPLDYVRVDKLSENNEDDADEPHIDVESRPS